MINKIYKELFLLLILFAGIWYVFSLVNIPKSEINLTISIETEEDLGDLLIENYLQNVTQVNDSSVLEAIEKITSRLENELDSSKFYYKFYIVENSDINAFATLGGHVVIYSGLLKIADSPEEIAAVLAHEIGHVEERHVANMLIKKLGVGVLSSILTGGDPAVIYEILEMSISSSFSRKHEGEADDFSLKLLEKANISPYSLASIFRKMSKMNQNKYEKELEFISSHPETDKRIRKSIRYKTKENFKSEAFDIDWNVVKENLM